MNRLTQKFKDTYLTDQDNLCVDYCDQARTYIGGNVLNKLGQKEDDDEELEIDSHILFKALKQGYIYVREHNTEEKEIVCEGIRLNFFNKTLDFVEPRKEIGKGRNLFQYGETWALTKEELKSSTLIKPISWKRSGTNDE